MKKLIILAVALSMGWQLQAHEGMWMLNKLKQINEAEMKGLGLELSADDIYNINKSSVKDAIGRMNYGMCTVEMISPEGLTLTNHHCAYGAIQSLSSVKNDYLTNGFWAKSKEEELPIEGMVISYLVRIDDVTARINEALKDGMSEDERNAVIGQLSQEISGEMSKDGMYDVDVKSFFGGNEFYAFTYITYRDVRLAGTPPESIGKFGGDTDNWMWPRHTGDFSLLRVYAGPDGMPADYSKDNVPHKPKHFLPVSLDGVEEGDFAMVMGFPGSTDRYLSSYGVEQALEIEQPARVEIRGEKLRLMKEDMDADPAVRIQYASKYAGVANYWKYFQGQSRGLKRLKVYDQKKALEADFVTWANKDPKRKEMYGQAIADLEAGYNGSREALLPRTYVEEAAFGSEILNLSIRAYRLGQALEKEAGPEAVEAAKAGLMERQEGHFKDYNMGTDKKITARMLEMYAMNVNPKFHTDFLINAKKKAKGNWTKFVDKMFAKSIFSTQEKLLAWMKEPELKTLQKDPAYVAMTQFYFDVYLGQLNAMSAESEAMKERGYRHFIAGLQEMNPDKAYYPNANSTMRLTYGIVDDYVPADGMLYDYVTTTDGILQKEDPDNPEFVVPSQLSKLIREKRFGQYADDNGELIVCFISNNDITGGNSGSPVINGRGELIGLAFDGNWEAMSGDIAFEPDLQRTISVDIRYVLFVIDQFAGAKNLIEELKLVKAPIKVVEPEIKEIPEAEMLKNKG